MPNASNVTAGKPKITGAVYRAPAGTTLPTDASTALNNSFVELGFVSEDGVTNTCTPDSEKIKAWGGQVVLVVSSEYSDTFTLTLIETLNKEVAKTVYNDDNVVDITDGFKITVNGAQSVECSFVIDMTLKNGAMKRIVIPSGAISEVGEIVYKDDEVSGYEITIDALPDTSGNNHYEYIKTA